jgi:tyrosyl-tRNA synthetase
MDKIDEVLTRTITNIIPAKKKLEQLLKSGKKLNVYLGIDPTATKIHLGNAVALRKLQEFVELGHKVSFIIGDFTALIGDSSDKESERPILSYEEIQNNFKTYKDQASKILDFTKVKIRFNSEWLDKLTFREIVKLAQHFSFGDFASRELIKKRLNDKKHVGLHEALYPAMQGYDSYFLDTDIQIGGADQTFNMQAGRILQKDLRNKESYILVTGYLEGTDGRKMSKSWGNAIWITDTPDEMFGKIMSIRDNLIVQYFTYATNSTKKLVDEVEKRLKEGENPINLKKELGIILVTELHSKEAAEKAQGGFKKTFQERTPEFNIKVSSGGSLAGTISPFTSLASISDAKRLVKQNAVDVNGGTITDPGYIVQPGDEIKVGSRTFLKAK